MAQINFDRRFLGSTRGRMIMLLRRNDLTVNGLAAELGLTDNAVRAHLLSLERDGLVTQKGMVKGIRKPHYIYGLSDYARELFPRPYGLLFNRLLSSLRSVLSPSVFIERIRDIGFGIGKENKDSVDTNMNQRVDRAIAAIESLGGSATAASENGQITISSNSCPFSEAVREHPEVCKITDLFISDYCISLPVSADCLQHGTICKCRLHPGGISFFHSFK